MKRQAWVASVLVLGLMGVGAVRLSFAEDAPAGKAMPGETDPVVTAPAGQPAEAEPDYAFGTVKNVSGDQLVINEFDYDSGEEKEVTYTVDSKTAYDNVASLKEVAVGDEVDIDYHEKDGKKVAVTVAVAKPLEGETE